MSSIDNRIVKMQFDNASFKREAVATKASLEQVDAAVTKAGNTKGLLSLSKGMETVAVKASAMQVAAVTAIANIANRAVNAGITMAKSLTLDPIKQGFAEYELKMKSIRTILANTEGETLKSVTGYLDELNEYSDKTIYNFANMTQNIGKMTTAGIKLGVATEVVKGFSNMVALAGGDSMAAAGALEQFVYGLQAGKITALDWQSIATRGLGSVSLQKAFYETAKAAGTLGDVPVGQTYEEWSKAVGGFKGSLESGWLTAEVATDALSIMTGDVKDVATLMKQGFSKEVAEDLLDIAEKASLAATEVYSFTTFMDTLKEQIGSGWAKVLETVIGDVEESTALFTGWADTTGKILGKFFGYIGRLAEGWANFGGQSAALKTIQHILSPIAALLGVIAVVWREIFGGTKSGKSLAEFSKLLERMTRPLEVLAKLIRGSVGPIDAFFRLINIGKNLVKSFVGPLIDMAAEFLNLDKLDLGDGGILDFVKKIAKEIGKAIEKVDRLIERGMSLKDALGKVSIDMPKMPKMPDMPNMPDISGMSMPDDGALAGLEKMFSKFKLSKTISDLDLVAASLGGVSHEAENATTVGDKVMPAMQGAWNTLKKFFTGFNVEDLMASINLAVLSTFAISMSKFMNTMSAGLEGFVGTGEAMTGVFGEMQNALGSFQTAARAKMIIAIAIAIGILAVSLWLLSKIPMKGIAKALFALSGIMLILKVGVDSIVKAADAMSAKGTVFKLGALSVTLLALGFAMLTLSAAFLIMERVSWSAMLKGLGTIIVVMTLIEKMGKVGEHGAKNLLGTAVALTALSISLVILAGALLLFELVKWESLAKAGAILGGIALALGLLAKIPDGAVAKAGYAMLAVSIGMLALAAALMIFAYVKWESVGKAAVMLGVLAVAIGVMMALGGPVAVSGMVGLGVGLLAIAAACLVLNKVSWESIGKMAVVLTVLLVAFAALMGIVYLAAPVIPLLMGLALSLAALAGALALMTLAVAIILPLMAIGVGAFAAFATGAAVAIAVFLTTLALQAPIMKKSILTLLQTLIDGIVEAVPMVIDGIKRLFEAIKKEFTGGGGRNGPQAAMGKAGGDWVDALGKGIQKYVPRLVDIASKLIIAVVEGLTSHARDFAEAGIGLVAKLIDGISGGIDRIVTAAVNLIIAFAEGIAGQYARILRAGVTLIADFLHALADTIRSGSAAIGSGISDVVDAMRDVGVNMVKGLISGLTSMMDDAFGTISTLAEGMISRAKSLLKMASPSKVFRNIGKFLVEGLSDGIQKNAASAITATASMVSGSIAVASAYVSQFVQELDQQAIAAQGKADGLRRAAEKAAKAARKTEKNKKDDRAADKLSGRAGRAERAAEAAARKSEVAAAAEERAAQFAEADTFDKAKMKSEDAQSSLDAAKMAERRAAASLAEAAALEKQAKADGVKKKQRKEMQAQAEKLRAQAKVQAADANRQLLAAQTNAGQALALQRQAGAEAAAEFQRQFEDEASQDAAAAAYEKLTPAEKAAERRRQAAALQTEANKDLADAKALAYTDLEAANELAAEAMEQADQARTYLQEALQIDADIKAAEEAAANGTATAGTNSAVTASRVVNLDPTEAAALAFRDYNDVYSNAAAAAAAGNSVEFNQYNTSPEALDPTEIYRQSNNLLSFAASRLQPTP